MIGRFSVLGERDMSSVRQRLIISFVVAWIAYALTYFLRKPLGVVRKRNEDLFGISRNFWCRSRQIWNMI